MSYIDTMKSVVRSYKAEVEEAAKQIAEARNMYNERHSSDVISAIMAGLEKKQRAATAEIAAARSRGVNEAKAWGKLDGREITADAELLKYDLTPEDFDDLVERYQGNATMSHLLMSYGTKVNKGATLQDGDHVTMLNLANIDTSERRAHEAETAGGIALDILDRLTVDGGYMQGVNSPMVQAMVGNFLGE